MDASPSRWIRVQQKLVEIRSVDQAMECCPDEKHAAMSCEKNCPEDSSLIEKIQLCPVANIGSNALRPNVSRVGCILVEDNVICRCVGWINKEMEKHFP